MTGDLPASSQPEAETIENILDRVRSGDLEAYAEVIRAYQGQVWKVVAFGLREPDASADLVQATFVNAYFTLDRFEKGRDFGPWVRTIARNLVRGELRRRGREQRRFAAYHQHLETCSAGEARAQAHEDALLRALTHCREELSEPSREALALRYERSLGFSEIAEKLGRTLAATRQLLQRIRLQLRACIEHQMEAS